jgi:uncharacterized membrane protein
MIDLSIIIFGTCAWFAGAALISLVAFPLNEVSRRQMINRRAAGLALFIVWLMIGIQFYTHYGLYGQTFG